MDRFWSRDKIKEAIKKHDKNLTDCFNSFLVSNQTLIHNLLNSPSTLKIGTSYQQGVAADNEAAERRSGVHSDSNPVVLSEYSSYWNTYGLTDRSLSWFS